LTETINYWSEVLEDEGLSPAFLQLNREVVNFDSADKGTLISSKFRGIEMSGYTFVLYLKKEVGLGVRLSMVASSAIITKTLQKRALPLSLHKKEMYV
jgi:hypothetical protein